GSDADPARDDHRHPTARATARDGRTQLGETRRTRGSETDEHDAREEGDGEQVENALDRERREAGRIGHPPAGPHDVGTHRIARPRRKDEVPGLGDEHRAREKSDPILEAEFAEDVTIAHAPYWPRENVDRSRCENDSDIGSLDRRENAGYIEILRHQEDSNERQ